MIDIFIYCVLGEDTPTPGELELERKKRHEKRMDEDEG